MKIKEKVLFSLAAVLLVSCGAGNTPANNNGDGPSVIEVRPIADETEVSLDAMVSVTFDRTIACVSFEDAFSLQNPAKDEVLGQISCVNDVVTMKPLNQLKPATTYTITIDTALVDSDDVAIETTYVWSFTTTKKAWRNPVQIDQHSPQVATHIEFVGGVGSGSAVYDVYNGLTAHTADIDVNDNGTVGVAWSIRATSYHPDFLFGKAYGFTQFNTDTGWESEQTISYGNSIVYGQPTTPVVGVTSADALLAVWGHNAIQPIKGSNLGNLLGVADIPPISNSYPYGEFSMSSDQLGNAFLAYPYVLDNGDASNISVYRYTNGTGWDAGQVLNVRLNHVFTGAKVAVNSSGFATIIWVTNQTATPFDSTLCYSHYSPDFDEWSEADCFAAVPGGTIYNADVGIDDQGNSVAVWSIGEDIFYSVHPHDDPFDWKDRSIRKVTDDKDGLVAPFESFRLAMNKSGQAILGWATSQGGIDRVGRASSYLPDLDEWTEPVTLYSGQTPGSQFHDVDINDQGNALVVYTAGDYDGSTSPPYYIELTSKLADLIAVPHNPLDGWLTPQIIVSDGAYYGAQIAIDNAGNATAVFKIWEGKDAYFWASRYE